MIDIGRLVTENLSEDEQMDQVHRVGKHDCSTDTQVDNAEFSSTIEDNVQRKSESSDQMKRHDGDNAASVKNNEQIDSQAYGSEGNDEHAGKARPSESFQLSSGLLPFPEKLMSILNSSKVSDTMWWLADGDAFCLIPASFSELVLEKYFQGTKFESFTRKLNRWGFKRVAGQKVPPNTIAYYHKDFIKGSPELLKNMNGGKSRFATAREKHLRSQQKESPDPATTTSTTAMPHSLFHSDKFVDTRRDPTKNPNDFGSLDQIRLNLLTSNSLAIEQEFQLRRMQQQQLLGGNLFEAPYFNAKQALALQQQQNDLQIQHLLSQQSAIHGLSPNLRDSLGGIKIPWMQNAQSMPLSSDISRNFLQQRSVPSSMDQALLARQMSAMGTSSNNSLQSDMLQQLMVERLGVSHRSSITGGSNANVEDIATARRKQEQMIDEKFSEMSSVTAASQSLAQNTTNNASVDKQLLELYLLQQQKQRQKSGNDEP